jgi:cytochrome P450/NADPH-cytochrome P450 reductase
MLFFGCRHPEQDFIYEKELRKYAADGVAELHVAFSRYNGAKTYVQDLLKAQAARVKELIAAGAVVYVCGDGGRMEPDVKKALGEMTDVAKMAAENRYVLDVWASS